MKSGSWASYLAAMPPECRGEPDEDDHTEGPTGPPTWFAAVWFDGVECRDYDTGELSTQEAQCKRFFSRETHARPYEAALRWVKLMAGRKGVAWLEEGWDDGESFESRYLAGE